MSTQPQTEAARLRAWMAIERIEHEAAAKAVAALQEVVDQFDDYGPTGVGFTSAIEHARSILDERSSPS